MKIAFVGGGSYSWGPQLLGDLSLSTVLSGTVCLVDLDAVAGERMERVGQRMMAARGAPWEVTYTPQLATALEGADVVILSITTGGLEAMRGDLAIPEQYGIYQSVGDTVGPGGIARGLRNIPVIVELARQMERHCPRAWLLNVTNPMTTLCRSVARATSIRTIGLCHEMRGVQHHMRDALGSSEGLDGWRVAGINHFSWMIGADPAALTALGQRLTAALPAPEASGSPFNDNFRVKLDLLALYGTFAVAGDRHVAEFLPSYLRTPEEAFEAYGVRLTSIAQRQENRAQDIAEVQAWAEGSTPLETRFSGEQAVPIVELLYGGHSAAFEGIAPGGEFVVNIPNTGQLPQLQSGAVVECMATVDQHGVHPTPNGTLPHGVLGWVQGHIAAQELVVEAALDRRFDLALQALRLDPLSHRLNGEDARDLLQALDRHNARYGAALAAD